MLLVLSSWPPQSSRAAGSGPLVHLPRDQAAHLNEDTEWWYVVGHLKSGKQRFGYEMTIFRFDNVRPPGSAPGTPGIKLYRADMAITEDTGHQFHQRISYFFPQSGHVSATTLDVGAGNAHLSGKSPSSMDLRFQIPAGSAKLHLASQRPAMNVGGRGYLKFADGYTYYYSLTDIKTSGTLVVNDQTFHVTGTSWLDHQWGTWSWANVSGWTWMALQLNNGVQLSVFDFRSPKERVKAASVLPKSGKTQTLRAVTFTPLGHWKSPHTGGNYPSGFAVSIPGAKARLRVIPTVNDQELWLAHQNRGSYWEGSATVTGTWQGKPISGLAYTELTGYAK
jgi:predicted secreted hydrolase